MKGGQGGPPSASTEARMAARKTTAVRVARVRIGAVLSVDYRTAPGARSCPKSRRKLG